MYIVKCIHCKVYTLYNISVYRKLKTSPYNVHIVYTLTQNSSNRRKEWIEKLGTMGRQSAGDYW